MQIYVRFLIKRRLIFYLQADGRRRMWDESHILTKFSACVVFFISLHLIN